MKLDITVKADKHTEICTACAWAGADLVSCSDDKQLIKWGNDGEFIGTLATIDAFVTSIAWYPDLGKRSANMFACACTDGTWRVWTLTSPTAAREEKKVTAHTGAVISVKWSHDGSALISAGEDGQLKVWSRSGNLRSSLASSAAGCAIYCFVWGPDNDSVLWAEGKALHIKSYQGNGRKATSWAAHEGVILACDWNRINDLIVSGGEDCIYRVWDSFGRQLFQSTAIAHVITSIAWSPNGECFAVGSYNSIRLCDRTGWSHDRKRPDAGSIMQIAWTADGTQFAGAGGSGAVLFAQIVERKQEWRDLEATLVDPKLIHVQDAGADAYERLDFARDRVVEMALGWQHLVVATTTQCFIYNITNWNTPHIFDLKATPQTIILSEAHFATLDPLNGVTIFSYEGRQVSNPRFNGMRSENLNRQTVSLCKDCVAILDRADSKSIRCFDVNTGKQLAGNLSHKTEIVQLSLNQTASSVQERRVAFIDRNRDLYLSPVTSQPGIFRGSYKLQTQVDTIAWNDTSDMLCAVADARLVTWLYPNVCFVDRDLIAATTFSRDASEFGKVPVLTSFSGTRATVRRADGALVTTAIPSQAPSLYQLARQNRWEEAVRLCRFVKEDKLWGCLAAMAIQGRQLDTAEVALAALGEVDKLEYVLYMKKIPSEEGRSAELALYRRCPDEAETILLQARPPLIYRAIDMNLRLFRWHRGLELAVKHKKHIDLVIGSRRKYLENTGREETDKRFLQFAETEVDWEAIEAKIENEIDDERARGGSIAGGK